MSEPILVGATLFDIMREYGVLRESDKLIPHLIKLHNDGQIALDVKTLVENHGKETWDRKFRIDLKDLSAHGAIKLVVSPMHHWSRYTEIRMLDNNVVEFWWD